MRKKVYRDELGRERIPWPHTHQLSVYLFASLYRSSTSTSTSAMYVGNLEQILKLIIAQENKMAVMIICGV